MLILVTPSPGDGRLSEHSHCSKDIVLVTRCSRSCWS